MKQSIFFKIFGGYVLLTIALSGLIVFFSSYVIRSYHIERTAQQLTDLASVVGAAMAPYQKTDNFARLDGFIKDLGHRVNIRITVIAADGTVIADSEKKPADMENHRTRTEVAQALEGETGRFLRVSETLGKEMLYIAIPVEKDGKTSHVIRVSKFLRDIKAFSMELNAKVMQIAIVILVISLFAAFLLSRTIYGPIKELSRAIRRVANHDFNVRVLLRGRNELKEVADNFNNMTDEMEGLFSELTRQKEELNSIISSLQEGLLVLDSEERVLLANDSLKNIAGQDLAAGMFYWEVLREPKVNELIKKARGSGKNFAEEIDINEKVFLCSVTFLSFREEIIMVFHDITEFKKLEKIKTDFVLNVSHELRTPLTSIKGFIETIEEGVLTDENKRYLEIIKRNTDRLINIVSDLLALSELEEKSFLPQPEAVDLPQLMEGVLKIFEERIKLKGFSIEVKAQPGLPPVLGDPYTLEQVFINLFDNAIKYTQSGGITITMGSLRHDVVITLADTGPGIPSEHIDRIFERFYVVDRSRSKKLGGTGLGLSIVKHIINLHNGRIRVESTVGKGTTFTITLPACQ